jgi:hypothetical protein
MGYLRGYETVLRTCFLISSDYRFGDSWITPLCPQTLEIQVTRLIEKLLGDINLRLAFTFPTAIS